MIFDVLELSSMYFGNKNGGAWLFLERLIDTPDNELIIYVCNSALGGNTLNAKIPAQIRKLLSKHTPIVPDNDQLYKICFDSYIMYQTGNESYASFDPNEIRTGDGLVLFEKSRFLDSLNKYSNAFDNENGAFPDKFRHYGVYTLNHVVDIISHVKPTVEKVKSTDIAFSEGE